ncbi:hypothetical protein D3C72_2362580 [compost metagenome]
MNAYELEQAAFDTAADGAEETVEYVQAYADGAFNIYVTEEVASKILECRAAWIAEAEATGEGQNARYHRVQKVLEEIEL